MKSRNVSETIANTVVRFDALGQIVTPLNVTRIRWNCGHAEMSSTLFSQSAPRFSPLTETKH